MNYGPVWIDIEGSELLDTEAPLLQHHMTGGVLLFANNFRNISQLKTLAHDIRATAGKPILIAVDHEGGRIWRFNEGFHRPDASQSYGVLYKQDPDRALEHLKAAGQIVAHELLNCGVDLTFAPVLDVDCGISTVIGDRSYSADPLIVANCARAFISGLNSQGMGSVGKHFPGHGGCVMDSHFSAAIDTRAFAEIEATDIVPFARLNNVLTGIMPAHVVYSSVDPESAGFSKFWLQKILRQQLGFKGAIISDCLSMIGSGFAANMTTGIERALYAGCDMVIASKQSREHLLQILSAIQWTVTEQQQIRIEALAGDFTNPNLRVKQKVLAEMMRS